MEKNRDCTLLVTSCDAYRDMERPFLTLLRRYWGDCPFETVLLSETGAEEGFDRVILTGRGKTWSEMLVEALDQIDTPYVIMQMNDFLFNAPVCTSRLLALVAAAKAHDALNLRLIPNPPGLRFFGEAEGVRLMENDKNRAYSASCQDGIWNRLFLRELATKTRSAWEFERYGSYMFDLADSRPLLVCEERQYPTLDTVHKGYWTPAGVKLLADEKIDYDFSRRGLPPLGNRLKEWLKRLVFGISPELVTRIQNFILKERK